MAEETADDLNIILYNVLLRIFPKDTDKTYSDNNIDKAPQLSRPADISSTVSFYLHPYGHKVHPASLKSEMNSSPCVKQRELSLLA